MKSFSWCVCKDEPSGELFSIFFFFFFDVNFSWWTFGGETGNFFRVSRSLSFFPVNEILSEPGCWTLKSWVFRVNEKRSLSEPEKLKISVWSIQVNWVWVNRKTTQKDLRTRKKSSLSNRQMSKGKSEHQTKNKKKKWKSASPKASPFTKHHKTFHYPERDKIQFSYPIEGPKCGCLRKNSLCSTKILVSNLHDSFNFWAAVLTVQSYGPLD